MAGEQQHAGPGPAGSPAAIVTVDTGGEIRRWTPGAQALFGYSEEEAVGRHAWMLVPPHRRDERALLADILHGATIGELRTQRRARDGRLVPVVMTASPVRDRHGRIAGAEARYAGRDDASEHAGADPLLRLVIDTAHDAYVAADADGRITDWNPAAEVLFGWSYADAVGRVLADTIVPERLRDAHRRGMARYRGSREGRLVGRRVELPALRRDGSELLVDVTIAPLEIDGEWQFSAFLREADEPARVEREAERLARLGSWEWDVALDSMTWSPEQCRIFGTRHDGEPGSISDYLASVHPDDAVRVRANLEQALDEGEVLELDHRIRRPGGETRWLRVRATVLRDAAGHAVRLAGTTEDVSERVAADRERRRLAAAVAATGDAVLGIGRDGRVTSFGGGARELYGLPAEHAVGRPFAVLFAAERGSEAARLVMRALAGEPVTCETTHARRDGAPVDVSVTLSPVRDDGGRVVEAVAVIRDVGPRKRAEDELRRQSADLEALARRDPLTGLLNAAELNGALEREIGRARAGGTSCSLLLAGVAGLPGLEGREGRQAGERVLLAAATALREAGGAHLDAFRAGGTTFGVVLAGVRPGGAAALAGRLAEAWTRTGTAATLETAIATFPQDGDGTEEILDHAEGRLSPATAVSDADDQQAIRSIVALLRRHLGMEVAYLSEFVAGTQVVRVVDAGPQSPRISPGTVVATSGSYCRRMADAELSNVIPDTAADPVAAALPVTRDAQIGAYVGVPVRRSDGRLYGSLCGASRAALPRLAPEAQHFARVCARLIADLIEQRELAEENRRLHAELTGVRALLAALSARDHYTAEHSEEVVALARAVARRMGLSPAETLAAERVALLHDIGKIGIPDTILQKSAPLDPDEWRLMREHPAIGARIVESVDSIAHLALAVRAEHERWDGQGYPDGLRGVAIPIASRVVFACDALHAMTSDRPYRPAMSLADARAELRRGSGTQFDPAVVAALLDVCGGDEAESEPARVKTRSRR